MSPNYETIQIDNDIRPDIHVHMSRTDKKTSFKIILIWIFLWIHYGLIISQVRRAFPP